jgi:hypothetical protein
MSDMANVNLLVPRTLQELIAPRRVLFYDKHWELCGERHAQADMLCEVTHIDINVLKREPYFKPEFSSFSIARRMSWAAMRETTREEDMAYCLFGIFDVQLAPLYGEGLRKAFGRLQEEIIKTSTSHSLRGMYPIGVQRSMKSPDEQS